MENQKNNNNAEFECGIFLPIVGVRRRSFATSLSSRVLLLALCGHLNSPASYSVKQMAK